MWCRKGKFVSCLTQFCIPGQEVVPVSLLLLPGNSPFLLAEKRNAWRSCRNQIQSIFQSQNISCSTRWSQQGAQNKVRFWHLRKQILPFRAYHWQWFSRPALPGCWTNIKRLHVTAEVPLRAKETCSCCCWKASAKIHFLPPNRVWNFVERPLFQAPQCWVF